MVRHRLITALLIAIGLGGLIVAGCNSPTSSGTNPNTRTETWTIQLDQDAGGLPGRIWFVVNVTLRDDPAQGACTGSTVTTGLGDISSPPSRIQRDALTGNATASWTRGAGSCDAFDMTLSPLAVEDFVVTGTHAAASMGPVPSGFGPIDPSAFVAGTWSAGGTVRGKAYVYPKQLGYLPDSHFDLRVVVSEGGCGLNNCYLPSAPAASLCLNLAALAQPSCAMGYVAAFRWLKDTTIDTVLPRHSTQVDDRWFFSLVEGLGSDGGGPPFQMGCVRSPTGADKVELDIVSGVASPLVTCGAGWTPTGLLNKSAGDMQTGEHNNPLPADLQVQLLGGNAAPVAGAVITWAVSSGGGYLNHAQTATDANGYSSVQWTLGGPTGLQTVTATAEMPGGGTASVTFQATATLTAPPPSCGVGGGAGTDHPGGSITANEAWDAAGNPHRVNGVIHILGATLTVGPGTVVCFDGFGGSLIGTQTGGRVVAVGTAAAPILFTAMDSLSPWGSFQLVGTPTDTNYFENVRIAFSYDGIVAYSPVIMDSTVVRQSLYQSLSLFPGAGGSRIIRSRFDTTNTPLGPTMVQINASDVIFSSAVFGAGGGGVSVSGGNTGVSFDNCEVSGSGAAGITTNAVITIHNCNLRYNAGNGVESTITSAIDATYNWWGDPAGPLGPGGDGVRGNVNYTPFFSGPLGLVGYAPPVLARVRGKHR